MTIKRINKLQRNFFNSNLTKDISFRVSMLSKLEQEIKRREEDILLALKKDLNKSETEAYLTEISIVLEEIKLYKKKLAKWSKRQRKGSPISHWPSSSYIYREPYGNVLVLAPWNYPFQLAVLPLVGAIAGGNTVVLKPSRNSKHTSEVIRQIVREVFPEKYVYCVEEEISNEEILKGKYDLIFFTGSPRAAKDVMKAAAKRLTPVVLELGGKSPCIIDSSADLEVAARRLAWGKFLNAGQTCVAPEYLLIDNKVKDKFIVILKKYIKAMYGDDALVNKDYVHIINDDRFNKLSDLISNSILNGHEIYGGRQNEESLCIEPTIICDASWDDEVMNEEIFGPILPVIGYDNLAEEIEVIKSRPRPLALYIFSKDKKVVSNVINSVSFGGGCVNDVVMHVANNRLPFGGVGNSGMGVYHGKYTFETFTRPKSIEYGKNYLDIPLRYPPYKKRKLKLIRKILG